MSDNYRDMIMGHALSKKKSVSSFPFDDTTEVFKVSGRIFMLEIGRASCRERV